MQNRIYVKYMHNRIYVKQRGKGRSLAEFLPRAPRPKGFTHVPYSGHRIASNEESCLEAGAGTAHLPDEELLTDTSCEH